MLFRSPAQVRGGRVEAAHRRPGRTGVGRAVQAGMILAKQMYQSSAISRPANANPLADSVASPVTDATQAVKKTQTHQ